MADATLTAATGWEQSTAHQSPAPLTAEQRASFAWCHDLTRRRARNFYYGLKLTPEPKRSAVFAVYAFMRACDDMADAVPGGADAWRASVGRDRDAALARIERFRAEMDRVLAARDDEPLPPAPFWPAFVHVVRRYGLPAEHLHAMLDGQRCDLLHTRYRTFDELYDYCYKVASVVGLVCVRIWGDDGDPSVRQLAEYRGVAMQLTNILRDVAEDARRDRIYLPQEDLERFGVSERRWLDRRPDENYDRLMTYQIERARGYYDMSASLERHVSPDCRATSETMMRIYRGLLTRIADDPRRVLTRRVRLSSFRKLGIALSACLRNRR